MLKEWTRSLGGWALAAMIIGATLVLFPALASAQVADAVVEVLVVDESKAVLPGVTVTVVRPDTGFTQTGVTGPNGVARFLALQPGIYNVKFELAGFATVNQEGVTLLVGQTAKLSATLTVAKVSETVTVIAEATLVDVYKTDSSTNITPEQIKELPVANRDFQSLAFLAPGVQRERGGNRFIGNGPVIGAAGNASQSTIMVDGVDFTDPVLGLARARFSQDAVGEFRVIANRFDTEIGGSAGGALSIVTKSGTNNLHGSAFAFFRDKSLRAKGEFEIEKVDYSRQQYGGTLGGPIVKNKAHYFVSFEQVSDNSYALFRPGGAYASTAADIKVPFDQSLIYGGVDSRISDTQSLRMKFVYEYYRQDNFRVGGVADESTGMQLNRDNYNFTATHAWTVGGSMLNTLSFQFGQRKFVEPNNSSKMAEYFSSGTTLQTGAGIVGDQDDTGRIVELRDTFFMRLGSGKWAQDLKFGGALQMVSDDWTFPVYPTGLMLYLTDTRDVPRLYAGTTGEGRSKVTTNLISGFIQDDLRPSPRVTINLGLRYDIDTAGNNPDYTDPLNPDARGRDTNNFQPRAGFSWDIAGDGRHVARGGVGMFTGRYLLVPAHLELQQNGYTGRIVQQRFNGALIGLPAFTLDPNNPSTTGLPLPSDSGRIDKSFVNPTSTQATAGYTVKIGKTGLFADFEGVYVKGSDEAIIRDFNWSGNGATGCNVAAANCRPNKSFNQINVYTNEGRSEYKAFVSSLNGTLKGGHVVTGSFTVASKKNINDDFSPALTDYPSDPADIEAEWGRSRADERYHFTASAVFRLPARFTVAPIFQYGSGQPWNRRYGYDYNGDGKSSDRKPGVAKFSEEGPNFASVNLRVSYALPLGGKARADFIAEFFNLLNRVNYDVNSLTVNGAEYLDRPHAAEPGTGAGREPELREVHVHAAAVRGAAGHSHRLLAALSRPRSTRAPGPAPSPAPNPVPDRVGLECIDDTLRLNRLHRAVPARD